MSHGTFNYTFELRKADNDDGKLMIEGVASTTDVDLQKDQMTLNALRSMAKSAPGVPIVTSHNAEAKDMIGEITEANVDSALGQLVIKAELDSDDTEAMRLYSKLRKGYKLGLSIGGRASVSRGIGKSIVNDVALDHCMITRRPVNTKTFAYAVSKAMVEASFEDAFKSVDPTDKQREDHATYVEDGVGKFPIWNKASAESALDLIGHAPPDKQELIRNKACSILGPDSRPECKGFVNKSMTTEDLEKAGARLSADSIDALHSIHKNSDNGAAVRSAVEGLMGDAYDPAKGFADGSGSPDNAEAEVAGGASSDDDAIGVVSDGVAGPEDIKKALAETIKAELKAYADEIAKSIREELAPKEVPQVKDESEYTAARSFVNDIAAAMRL